MRELRKGAVYNGRQEKDDVLRLGKAVGALLEARGVDVVDRKSTRLNSSHPSSSRMPSSA